MNLAQKSPGVWIAPKGIVLWTQEHIDFVRSQAAAGPKLRARICAHQDGETYHEMLIGFTAASRCGPHLHSHPESLYVIEGHLKVMLEGAGTIYLQPKNFLRIPAGMIHCPTPLTDCVILESASHGLPLRPVDKNYVDIYEQAIRDGDPGGYFDPFEEHKSGV